MSRRFDAIFERESLDKASVAPIRSAIESLPELFEGLAFCLSENGDLLSQWRGYALNGEGFSIGFSLEYFHQLLFGESGENKSKIYLKKAIYEPSEQEKALLPIIIKLKEEVVAGKLKRPKPLTALGSIGNPNAELEYSNKLQEYKSRLLEQYHNIAMSLEDLYSFKNPAFSEENEWRLISHFTKDSKEQCQFRVSENRIVPYREIKLHKLGIPPISEVIIGPKNSTPEYVVKRLLSQHGLENVGVRRSDASYR